MKKIGEILGFMLMLLAGGICGFLFAKFLKDEIKDMGMPEVLFKIALCFLMLYAAVIIQIIIHEAGHLFFGLMSGYKFSSFRIFNFMWIKKDGKITLKKFNIAGTGGQCLLTPPNMKDGRIPVFWYNMGGCIMNLISVAVFGILAAVMKNYEYILIFLVMLMVIGTGLAVVNGIPIAGTVNNDGHNAISIRKDKASMKAFWITMKINEFSACENKRLKDMPKELFYMPSEEELSNSMISSVGVFYCNYLMDMHNFTEAKKNIEYMLEKSMGVAEIYRQLLKADLAYIYMLENEKEEAKKILEDKKLKQIMKAMSKMLSVIRTEYAYAKTVEADEEKTKKKKETFQKVIKTYPYKSDIDSELELMELIE